MNYYKPFRYETNCVNSGRVLDRTGQVICEVVQQEKDGLTPEDHAKLELIVQALNYRSCPFVFENFEGIGADECLQSQDGK